MCDYRDCDREATVFVPVSGTLDVETGDPLVCRYCEEHGREVLATYAGLDELRGLDEGGVYGSRSREYAVAV